MTPEQREAQTKRLVSAAKALLSLQVGLAVGARRIQGVLSKLGADMAHNHEIFAEFISAIPIDLPIGSARLLWEHKAMLKNDFKLAKVENDYRNALLEECIKIIHAYG